MTYKGAASLGLLLYGACTLPSLCAAVFSEKRPTGYVLVHALTGALQTVGLASILVAYGTRRSLIS